ncbi:hypothetical protein Aglo03_10550 [Actinokineospora globicatena]|uniref:Uncharacterized protein n=1 Tax=Actinokineospora globicatena TaxID=103729 RepID=A0A9W6QKH7_9PSEU|nr:hypothetical protein Aglo03_10550 [Actinokineospora globicatena]
MLPLLSHWVVSTNDAPGSAATLTSSAWLAVVAVAAAALPTTIPAKSTLVSTVLRMENHIPGVSGLRPTVPAYPPPNAAVRTDPTNHTIVRISSPA